MRKSISITVSASNAAVRMLLGLSLALPVSATANSREDLNQYFNKSKDYNQKYYRLLDLNATARPDIRFLEAQIPLKREALQNAENVYQDLAGQLSTMDAELAQIPLDIQSENDTIQNSENTIRDTISAAKSSKDFNPDDEITPDSLQAKADFYQTLVNQKQGEVDAKRSEISQVKQDENYQQDLSQRSQLERELANAQSRSSRLRSDNATLNRQIDQERDSLATWRNIQRTTSNQISNINNNVLPPLRDQESELEDEWSEADSAQRDLVFRLQRVQNNLRTLKNNEDGQERIVRRLRGEQQEARRRLERINETLNAIPGHRQEVQDINNRLQRVNQRISGLESQIKQKSGDLTQAQNRKRQLVAERDQLRQQKQSLERQASDIQGQIANLRKQKKNLEGADQEIGRLRGQIRAKRQQNQALRGEVQNLEGQRPPLRQRRRAINSRIEQIKSELENAEGDRKKQLRQERRRLVEERKGINQNLQRLNGQIKTKQDQIAATRAQIERMRSQVAELERGKERLREINQQIANLRQRKSNIEGQIPGVQQQLTQKNQQIERVNGRIANLNRELQPLRDQLAQATQRRQRLNRRKSELQEIIARKPQLEQRRERVRNNMANREREIRQETRELERIREDIEVAERRVRRLQVALADINREKDSLNRDLRSVRSEIARNESELSRLISRRDEAIRGEARSIRFIESSESTIAQNRRTIESLVIRIDQIQGALPAIIARIEAFEEENVAPLEQELAVLLQSQRSYMESRDTLTAWKGLIVDATTAIERALQSIERLEARKVELDSARPGLVARVEVAQSEVESAQADLASVQQQVTDLTNEFSNIEAEVSTLAGELKSMLRDIRDNTETDPDSAIVLGEAGVNSDESFEKNEELSSKDWETGIITNHKLTGETACVAFTTINDENGVEVARLEVYAATQELLDGEQIYSEPTIQIVTSSDDMFFLDGALKTNRTNNVNMAYSGDPAGDAPEQGAVLDLGEKDFMVTRLRADNKATVSLSDDAGEIVEYEFSLSGSSKTIRNAYSACGLK
ncbi:MAG: hypothetical protein HRT45_14890 [Bdellovibrionales bacterium]|nr:hypothetical protein [Bdellovibrionales bacterium]